MKKGAISLKHASQGNFNPILRVVQQLCSSQAAKRVSYGEKRPDQFISNTSMDNGEDRAIITDEIDIVSKTLVLLT